jgi:hypothetical protein
LAVGISCDNEDNTRLSNVTILGTAGKKWSTEKWNTFKWTRGRQFTKKFYTVAGTGRSVSTRIRGEFKDVSVTMSAYSLLYTEGGKI